MMKNVLIVFTVLAMASVANAAVKLSVNGVVDPPDTTINLKPSEFAVIDVHSNTAAYAQITYLVMQGPGLISKGPNFWAWEQTAVNIPSLEKADLLPVFRDDMGYLNITEIIGIDIMDASDPYTYPNGRVVDGLVFHCEALGEVVLTLFDADFNVLDSQGIHQIPEPITFALLGLGGLFLRRRK